MKKSFTSNKFSSEPQNIGSIINSILSEKGLLIYCKENSVLKKWPSIAGDTLSKSSLCERVENGILYVRVNSSSCRHEAIYRKQTILNRIRKEFSCYTIKDIVFY